MEFELLLRFLWRLEKEVMTQLYSLKIIFADIEIPDSYSIMYVYKESY